MGIRSFENTDTEAYHYSGLMINNNNNNHHHYYDDSKDCTPAHGKLTATPRVASSCIVAGGCLKPIRLHFRSRGGWFMRKNTVKIVLSRAASRPQAFAVTRQSIDLLAFSLLSHFCA